jgi:hypothetical protein
VCNCCRVGVISLSLPEHPEDGSFSRIEDFLPVCRRMGVTRSICDTAPQVEQPNLTRPAGNGCYGNGRRDQVHPLHKIPKPWKDYVGAPTGTVAGCSGPAAMDLSVGKCQISSKGTKEELSGCKGSVQWLI